MITVYNYNKCENILQLTGKQCTYIHTTPQSHARVQTNTNTHTNIYLLVNVRINV